MFSGRWLQIAAEFPLRLLKVNREEFKEAFYLDAFIFDHNLKRFKNQRRIQDLVVTDGKKRMHGAKWERQMFLQPGSRSGRRELSGRVRGFISGRISVPLCARSRDQGMRKIRKCMRFGKYL